MLYICSLLFIIIKGLAFVIKKEVLLYLEPKNMIFFIILLCAIMVCKKVLKYRRKFPDIVDHLMQYRFKNKDDYYYSCVVLVTCVIAYITGIAYLRFRAFNNPLDLKITYSALKILYTKLPLGVLCYNIMVLCFIIYFLILTVKLIKKRLNIHVVKMHFYLMSFKKYLKMHSYFDHSLSLESFIVNRITRYYKLCIEYVISLYLFGYYKEQFHRYTEVDTLPAKTRRYMWTPEEKKIYKAFEYNSYYFTLRNLLDKPLTFLFFNLHFIVLIGCLLYDILYHNYVLTHVAKILPILFIYQIYVSLSQLARDKIIFDVALEIKTLYYDHVTYLDEKNMFVNGALYERPDYEYVIKRFLEYEATAFNWTRMK